MTRSRKSHHFNTLIAVSFVAAGSAAAQWDTEDPYDQGGFEDPRYQDPYGGQPDPYGQRDPYGQQPGGFPQGGYGQGGFAQNPGPLATLADVPQGRVAMMDINGFGQPVPAYHFERPAGYRVDEAVIAWSPQPCGGMTPMERIQLSGPQGQVIRTGGLEGWMNGIDRLRSMFAQQGIRPPATLQSCPDKPVISAAQYLTQIAQRTRPGAQIVSQRGRPDIIQHAYQEMERDRAFMTPQALQALQSVRLEAAELRLVSNGPNGPQEEILLTAMGSFRVPDSPFPMTAQVVVGVMSMTAPQGQLDPTVLESLWKTSTPIEAYQRHQQQKELQLERAQDQEMQQFARQAQQRLAANKRARGGGRFYTQPSGNGSPSGQGGLSRTKSWDAFNNRMNAMDQNTAAMGDAQMGTTTVYDPFNGHDIAVQGNDMDVWRTDSGQIISRPTDEYYNPSDEGISATKLDPLSEGGGDFWTSDG